jgi:hypothetical protein
MQMELHRNYPQAIKNVLGIVVGIKLMPSSLPKEGPISLHEIGYPAILMACNLWEAEDGDSKHWDWYYCHDPEINAKIDKFVREQALNFHQWYYLDVFDFQDGE